LTFGADVVTLAARVIQGVNWNAWCESVVTQKQRECAGCVVTIIWPSGQEWGGGNTECATSRRKRREINDETGNRCGAAGRQTPPIQTMINVCCSACRRRHSIIVEHISHVKGGIEWTIQAVSRTRRLCTSGSEVGMGNAIVQFRQFWEHFLPSKRVIIHLTT
jgi:hypothetical protein